MSQESPQKRKGVVSSREAAREAQPEQVRDPPDIDPERQDARRAEEDRRRRAADASEVGR